MINSYQLFVTPTHNPEKKTPKEYESNSQNIYFSKAENINMLCMLLYYTVL